MEREAQSIPIRLYQGDEHLFLIAPMPGLEPQDISVTIERKLVTIRGEERGAGQHDRDCIIDEWRIGPYAREVVLTEPVDGALTNATYGNGVLVLSMPKASKEAPSAKANFQLQPVAATRGERVGYTGS
ncbi:MAG TPA: Hsp20/alpha crystallin family protein, partial [Terriglobales bacterium]|nr:Hsp20/alpha crystallin family protein [Terriglobales bacterium]